MMKTVQPIRLAPSVYPSGPQHFAWDKCVGTVDPAIEGALKRMVEYCEGLTAENESLRACIQEMNKPAEPLKNNPAPSQQPKKAKGN